MLDDGPSRDATFLYELARDFETAEILGYLRRGNSPHIRRRAAEVLGDLADVPDYEKEEEVIDGLIQTVQDETEDDGVRARAADSLYRYGEDSFERLIGAMGDFDAQSAPDWVTARTLVDWLSAEYPEFRMVAAAALGRIGDDNTLEPLIDALTDPDPRVRVQAARSCGLRSDSRCVEPLAARLDDSESIVREEAAVALGTIGTRRALKELIPSARAKDETLRRIAIEELGQIGTLEPLVVLVRALVDDSPRIQRAAILSLIQLFVDAPPEKSDSIRAEVSKQLAKTDTEAVAPPLIDIMEESQREVVRRNAAWLLGEVSDTRADCLGEIYDCLLDALDDPDELTAQCVAASLAELDSSELERRLHIIVQDEQASEDVVDRAKFVLEQIGSDLSKELIQNAVDYTYVRDPADYTKQKRNEESDTL